MNCASASRKILRQPERRILLTILLLALAAGPADAAWHCPIDQRYRCVKDSCTAIAGPALVRIDETAMAYEQCSPGCETLAITLKRSFFGSRYARSDGALPGLLALRSRAGEYSEARLDAAGSVTALAYGTCRWQE